MNASVAHVLWPKFEPSADMQRAHAIIVVTAKML